MSVRNFFAELKRRNVYKVAVAYAAVAWLLIQIATQVFPFFEIPNCRGRENCGRRVVWASNVLGGHSIFGPNENYTKKFRLNDRSPA
jgi:hypothetical protein